MGYRYTTKAEAAKIFLFLYSGILSYGNYKFYLVLYKMQNKKMFIICL